MHSESPLLTPDRKPWYAGISAYQWLVLVIACAGWVFDTYENQIFNLTRGPLLKDLLHEPPGSPRIAYYGDLLLGAFLIGGALGGVLFGWLADRFGRSFSMIASILVYATFSALTAAAHTMPQVAVLRFLVAMGTGGEWAVAAALVAEVFPERARAQASGIFHATSILGVASAAGVAAVVGENWRAAYLVGLAPAILVFAVRVWIREPAPKESAVSVSAERPGVSDLWANRVYLQRAILGLFLAAVGLAAYWGVFVEGQKLAESMLIRHGTSPGAALKKATFAYGVVQNIGMGVGLFAMGPLCAAIGRRKAFLAAQTAALIIVPTTCFLPSTYTQLMILLPLFGMCVGGMHAGYAVYFPELFPTRLRATGAGLCFNGGRLVAAPMLWFSAWLKGRPGMDLRLSITYLSFVFVIGLLIAFVMPETKGRPLED